MNDWCFRDIYKGGLWEEVLYVCALISNVSHALRSWTCRSQKEEDLFRSVRVSTVTTIKRDLSSFDTVKGANWNNLSGPASLSQKSVWLKVRERIACTLKGSYTLPLHVKRLKWKCLWRSISFWIKIEFICSLVWSTIEWRCIPKNFISFQIALTHSQ